MTQAVDALYEQIWQVKGRSDCTPLSDGDRRRVAWSLIRFRRRLLDVGCGDGAMLRQLDGFEALAGVDVSEAAVRIARSQGLDVRAVDVNTGVLPFDSESFETVLCLDVIEHVFDPLQLVAELRRVTAPGGELLISTPNLRYVKRLFELAVLGRFPKTSSDEEGYDGGHIHYFTAADIKHLLRSQGFTIDRHVGVIPSDRLAILRRYAGGAPVRELLSSGFVIRAVASER